MIDSSNKEQLNKALEFIENYEHHTISEYSLNYAKTEIGKSCFLNNINEIPIIQKELLLQKSVNELRETNLLIDNTQLLMEIIDQVFLSQIDSDDQEYKYQNVERLKNQAAKNYYSMVLEWRIKGASFSEMISSTLNYWSKLDNLEESKKILVYVGKWGDTTQGNGFRKYWTDIRTKDKTQRINLAIVRIKEELDFLENEIIKFIEVLNELHFLEESFYNKIKYGTSNINKITLIKNGLSLSLANLLVDKYMNYLEIDNVKYVVKFVTGLIDLMITNNQNQVLINEVRYYATIQK